jgi:hypothetical protein
MQHQLGTCSEIVRYHQPNSYSKGCVTVTAAHLKIGTRALTALQKASPPNSSPAVLTTVHMQLEPGTASFCLLVGLESVSPLRLPAQCPWSRTYTNRPYQTIRLR